MWPSSTSTWQHSITYDALTRASKCMKCGLLWNRSDFWRAVFWLLVPEMYYDDECSLLAKVQRAVMVLIKHDPRRLVFVQEKPSSNVVSSQTSALNCRQFSDKQAAEDETTRSGVWELHHNCSIWQTHINSSYRTKLKLFAFNYNLTLSFVESAGDSNMILFKNAVLSAGIV